ncbi:hypothetical protein [Streptomyces rhizosphaerihabitans]|uniref:hypothetical protein n=1 Tax=Streptomyces rhizosphaerihabitans TaxID=1266770 RepID=UPI0021BFF51D|nr:hypothetical protein [Streptomyces rhizosphaerihabitans]MCT9010221.1 hypothetical protein [Streptomyces rhizosphaerihabitans]
MGVFERLLRRSRATEKAPTAEVRAAAQPVAAEAEMTTEAEVTTEAKGSSETKDSPVNEGEATAGTAGAVTTEDVDIPKQQTAEQAADNEAGKGSPT